MSPRLAHSALLLSFALAPTAGAQDAPPVPPDAAPGDAAVQDPGAQQGPAPGSREAMWPAPTAEDWQKPCLITWQRTYEDALAVSQETGRPILVCVNMDGEIASEHYAGIRYRQPEMAKLYEPYVCVIASVYRHNPRDYDEEGRRIPCPRFGGVTCGEHIAIEPGLFDKFLDGQRVAPRHIGVELDGKESYDVYYAFDTASVFKAIEDGIGGRTFGDMPGGDRPLLERVESRHSDDLTGVERAYLEADRPTRFALLEAAKRRKAEAPVDLLRLGIFDLDTELNRLAREALVQAESESAIWLIAEALRVPVSAAEREALVGALERLGAQFPRARSLAKVHRGLAARSATIDLAKWSSTLDAADVPPRPDLGRLGERLEAAAAAAQERPDDAEAQLAFAVASLEMAVDPETARALVADQRTAARYASYLFDDAQRAARRAEELGATGWRVNATIALADYYMGSRRGVDERAEAAVAELPAGEQGWSAMAVLGLFAEGRQRAISRAVATQRDWPAAWLTDVHTAYSVLARHPYGTEHQIVAHIDFLGRLGVGGQAWKVLDVGLARFPSSAPLHERLRGRILVEKGAAGLEPAYEQRLAAQGATPALLWFAGYASLTAAEYHKRAGDDVEAEGAYGRAIESYERVAAADPLGEDDADHFIAMALAGRARIRIERQELDAATADVLGSFARRERSAATLDGLNITPVGTARMLLAKAAEAGRADLAQSVQDALDALAPELLELPAFERGGPPPQQPAQDGGQRRRRR
jgi:hypothetical protein